MSRRRERLKLAVLNESGGDRREGSTDAFNNCLYVGLAFLRRSQEVNRKRAQRPIRICPERAPSGLLVRTPTIGGAENAACFSYSP